MSDSIPQLGDPFSAGITDPNAQGALGQPQSFWQHLAMFGGNLAASANARTGDGHLANGSGFAGPLGAAVSQTMQQAGNAAAQQQNTIGKNLENQRSAIGLPLERARAALVTNFLQNPQMIQQLMGGSGPAGAAGGPLPNQGGGASPYGGVAGGGSLAPVMNQLESGGRTSTPGIMGDGGAAFGPAQVHQGALTDVNNAQGTNFTLPQLAANPQLGTQVGNQYLAMQQQRFPGRPDLALAAYNAGPTATQNAVSSGQGIAGLPQSTQGYVQRGMSMLGGQPPAVGFDPSSGFGIQQQYEQQAAQLEQKQAMARMLQGMGVPVTPPPGDPAMIRQAGQAYLHSALAGPTAGAEAQARLQFTPTDLRSGGMTYRPDMGWIKNPALEEVQGPNGEKTYAHITPPLPGSPPGTPGESTPVIGPDGKPSVKAIPPNVQDARNKAYEDFTGKDTDSYLAAQNTHAWLEQMNHAATTLNQNGGFLQTGPTNPARVEFAGTVNDALRSVGMPEAFDANKIGAWEELKKATTTAGFELSSHYEGHARQAASTIINATSAVPAATNSPVGFQTVSAGIQEAAQSAIDLHEYKQNIFNQGGDMTRAEVDFYKNMPAQMYARRAISTVTPYGVKTPADMNRYLPGTYVSLPNGKLSQVPERPGAPPVPEYLKNAQPSSQMADAPPPQ